MMKVSIRVNFFVSFTFLLISEATKMVVVLFALSVLRLLVVSHVYAICLFVLTEKVKENSLPVAFYGYTIVDFIDYFMFDCLIYSFVYLSKTFFVTCLFLDYFYVSLRLRKFCSYSDIKKCIASIDKLFMKK